MRYLMFCLLWSSLVLLAGVPVARTILNTPVYQATASENRCVTGHFTSSVSEQITHLTLWDTSNPVYPRQGFTIISNFTWGQHSFRQPTVKDSLLFYLDSYVLRIVDISNIDIPAQLSQLHVTYMQCFAVWGHYVVIGTTEGAMLVFDIANPSQPAWVSSATVPGCVYRMWVCDDRLGVSCGVLQSNTAKLFNWDAATETFAEETSLESGGVLDYIGTMNGHVVLGTNNGNIRIYNYSPGMVPVLIQDFAGGYNLRQALCSGENFYALGEDNCIRIWEINANDNMVLAGHYDLSHMSMEQGALWEINGDYLLYSVDTVICLILDVSDLSSPPEFVDKYTGDYAINDIVVPEGRSWLYFNYQESLCGVKADSAGRLSEGTDIPDNGEIHRMQEYRQNLYLIVTEDNQLRLRVLNVCDPDDPLLVADMAVNSAQVFTIKDGYLFMGSIISVGKYLLDANGIPVLERTLSYIVPQIDYEVYFLDFDTSGGFDYGIGMWGDIFSGFYPILVYWMPDGSAGFLSPPYLLSKANVIGQYLYLTGKGVNILSLECGIPRLESIQEVNNHTKGVESSLFLDDRYMIECYEVSNQIRIYDLNNPRNPQLIHTIYRAHTSKDLEVIGNYLLCASGDYGIEVYELPIQTESLDETVPAISQLRAWPNPFKDSMTVSVFLDKAFPVRFECFNIRGQKLGSHYVSEARAGENIWSWDGKDQSGTACPAGVYIIRAQTREGVICKKVTRIN